MTHRILLLCLALLLTFSAFAQAPSGALNYPRLITLEGKSLKIHHPAIDRWQDYAVMEGWIPVEVTDNADGRIWVGAVRARARSELNLEKRLVTLRDQEVIDVRFSASETPQAVKDFARRAVRNRPQEVMLDEVLMSLAEDFEPPGESRFESAFNRRPPRIVVTDRPLQLLLVDQKPIEAQIPGTSLKFVVNTDWDVFYDDLTRSWYVINEGVWQTHSMLASGGWTTTDQIPEDFAGLALSEDWPDIRAALPARIPVVEPTPFLVSLEPTELISIKGEPRLQAVPGAGALQDVANTDRDLFRLGTRWYFLAAGRWFSNERLEGKWQLVDELPSEFTRIPDDHRRAYVRASVPGTIDAAVAYIEATMPRRNTVPAGARFAKEVVYVGAPQFQPISNTTIERAVNTPFAVLRHNNFYYLNHEAAWYFSRSPQGPWQVATVVPDAIFDIPPSDPLHYVTYLKPEANEGTDGEARFSYTEGYNGMYTIGRRVVQGTGWSYSPWVSYPGGSPVYWGWPQPYGWPYWGNGFYQPYGYYGGYFPPQTVTLSAPSRGIGGPAEVSEQDPRKTRAGYDYSTLDQQRDAAREAAENAADDLYVGADGQVYRRSAEGWSQHSDGEWDTMAELERQYGAQQTPAPRPEPGQRQAYRQNEEDAERMERYFQRRSKNYNMYSNIYVGR